MKITLDHVIPLPIEHMLNPDSAIWNTTCVFEQGNHYVIDAQSGKGKSTFVQTVYGIRTDYSGQVFIDQTLMGVASPRTLAAMRQHKLAILFQDLRLFLGLTARENIVLNASLSESPWAHRIDEMAKKLGVDHILEKEAGLLSYGERQRIATIRALAQPFSWILLDEPFSHLDKTNALASFELIKEVATDQDAGIILTSLGEDDFITFNNHLKL